MSGTSNLTTHKTYRIPKELASELKRRAKINMLTESQYVIKALKAYIRKR